MDEKISQKRAHIMLLFFSALLLLLTPIAAVPLLTELRVVLRQWTVEGKLAKSYMIFTCVDEGLLILASLFYVLEGRSMRRASNIKRKNFVVNVRFIIAFITLL